MINNINNIQNLSDLNFSHIDEDYLKDGYLIQALANLGQRIGLKGDSLTLNSFTFNDIYDSYDNDDADKIGFIKYNRDVDLDKYYFSIGKIQKNKINNITDSNYYELLNDKNSSKYDISSNVYFSDRFSLSNGVIINNIEYYTNNSFIDYNDNVLTCVLFGKKIGINNDNDCDVIYIQYDFILHKIIKIDYLIYIRREENVNNEDIYWYMLNECVYVSNDKYKLSVYTFNTEFDISQYYLNFNKDIFKNVCTSSNIISHKNISDIFLSDTSNTLFDVITKKDGIFYKSYSNYIVIDIEIDFNEESNVHFSFNESSENNIKLNKINKYVPLDKWSIYDFIKRVNNDYTYTIFEIINYYNKCKYMNSKTLLFEKLLLKLYEQINSEQENNNILDTTLYIPLDYKFYFISNDNDNKKLFYSLDNLVYELDLRTSLFSISNKMSNILIFDTGKSVLPKIINYKFVIDYDKKYSDIINKVNVENVNTLPFIDADNKWNINNVSTNIIAKGQNNFSSSFIVIIHEKNNTYTLNNELNSEYMENISLYGYNIYTDGNISAYLPVINDNNLPFFSSTIILYVDTDEENSTGNDSTFWTPTIDVNNNEVSWKIVKINDKNLSISDIIDINSIKELIEYQINLDGASDTVLLCQTSNIKYVNNENTAENYYIIQLINGPLYMALNRKSISELNLVTTNEKDEYFNSKILLVGSPDSNNVDLNKQISSEIKYLDAGLEIDDDAPISEKSNANNYIFGRTRYIVYYDIQYKDTVQRILRHTQFEVSQSVSYYTYQNILTISIGANVSNSDLIQINNNITNIKISKNLYNINKTKTKTLINIDLTELQTDIPTGYKAETFDDWTFNFDLPVIDFKEVILQDNNLLNRANILSLDGSGKLYNAFLGSHWQDSQKETLYLTTTNTNINIGQNTLSTKTYKKETSFLQTFKNFVLGFNKISLIAIPDSFENVSEIKKQNYPKIELFNSENSIKMNSKITLFESEKLVIQSDNVQTRSTDNVIGYDVFTNSLKTFDSTISNIKLPILHEYVNYGTDKASLMNVQYINNLFIQNADEQSIYDVTNQSKKYLRIEYNNNSIQNKYNISPTVLPYTIQKCYYNNQVFVPFMINVFKENLYKKSLDYTKNDDEYLSEEFVGINLFTLIKKYLNILPTQVIELYFNEKLLLTQHIQINNDDDNDSIIENNISDKLPFVEIKQSINTESYSKIHSNSVYKYEMNSLTNSKQLNESSATSLLGIIYGDYIKNTNGVVNSTYTIKNTDNLINKFSIFVLLNTENDENLMINSINEQGSIIIRDNNEQISSFVYTNYSMTQNAENGENKNVNNVNNVYDLYLNEEVSMTYIEYKISTNKYYKVFIRMNENMLNTKDIKKLLISY